MGRSRSRSPRRDKRKRSRSRSRDKDRRRRPRSRSRSPRRRRSRSFSPRRHERERDRHRDYDRQEYDDKERDYRGDSYNSDDPSSSKSKVPELSEADLEGKTEDEIEMMKVMGFGGFDSTKGKKVEGNDTYVANILHKRKYRQYMNRRGGFNRPLDFIA